MTTTTTAPTVRDAQFVIEMMVTDTKVYEVIAKTPKTITVRTTRRTGEVIRDTKVDQGPFPVNYYPVVPDPNGQTYRLYERKTGGYGVRGGRNLRPCTADTPAERVDWRF